MDKKTFELLKNLSTINNPTLIDCNLKENKDCYDYLLEHGYLVRKKDGISLKLSVSGNEAMENYQLQCQLLSLQKQNTSIQKTLKNIQWLLLATTVLSAIIPFFKS